MTEQPQSLRSVFTDGETKRKELESSWDTNSATFQENLTAAITAYEECLRIADRVSLFSPNETLEDIASGDLQYLLLNYYVAELLQRVNGGDRKALLLRARAAYERLLKMLDQYDILSPSDTNLYEKYRDDPGSFSTASKTDPSARRETKISRFREEKDLKKKLE
ncbi:Type 2A phosphatase-associated protein 42, partial [Cryomyces antarcticus]